MITQLTDDLSKALEKTNALQKRLLSIEDACDKEVRDLEASTQRKQE